MRWGNVANANFTQELQYNKISTFYECFSWRVSMSFSM